MFVVPVGGRRRRCPPVFTRVGRAALGTRSPLPPAQITAEPRAVGRRSGRRWCCTDAPAPSSRAARADRARRPPRAGRRRRGCWRWSRRRSSRCSSRGRWRPILGARAVGRRARPAAPTPTPGASSRSRSARPSLSTVAHPAGRRCRGRTSPAGSLPRTPPALALMTVPFVLPTVVVGLAFRALLPAAWVGTLGAILLAHVFFNYAVVVRVVGGLWGQLDPRYEQAARTLGASPWRAFRTVTWPLLRPAVVAADRAGVPVHVHLVRRRRWCSADPARRRSRWRSTGVPPQLLDLSGRRGARGRCSCCCSASCCWSSARLQAPGAPSPRPLRAPGTGR